jgi:hypothetical protein
LVWLFDYVGGSFRMVYSMTFPSWPPFACSTLIGVLFGFPAGAQCRAA